MAPSSLSACPTPADMVFIVDSSGSINEPNYQMALRFLSDVANKLHVENDVTRIGVIQYSDDVSLEFRMYSHGTRRDIQAAIDGMMVGTGLSRTQERITSQLNFSLSMNCQGQRTVQTSEMLRTIREADAQSNKSKIDCHEFDPCSRCLQYKRGTTNTAAAIEYVIDNMFRTQYGDRDGVPNYGIIITDGGSNDKERTFRVSSCSDVCGWWQTARNGSGCDCVRACVCVYVLACV